MKYPSENQNEKRIFEREMQIKEDIEQREKRNSTSLRTRRGDERNEQDFVTHITGM